jgi:hypothetical protein
MILNIPISDPLFDKKLMDSIKEYVGKNPPDAGSIIFIEELSINGGELEDKICETIKGKRLN